MAEEIIKTIENVDKLFSQIVVNGEVHNSSNYVPPAQLRDNAPRNSAGSRNTEQGEDVYGVNLNDTLHNFADRTVAEALAEESSARQLADEVIRSNIESINDKIPSSATAVNKLVDNASMTSAINVVQAGLSDLEALIPALASVNQAIASACAYCASSNTNVTGASLYTGATLKILFTAQIAGADTTSALTITYNSSSYTVKVAKDGSLVDFTAKASGNAFVYCQAYTTLELMFNGTNFIIIGNPVVISNSDYSVYADGSITYKDEFTTSLSGATYPTLTTFFQELVLELKNFLSNNKKVCAFAGVWTGKSFFTGLFYQYSSTEIYGEIEFQNAQDNKYLYNIFGAGDSINYYGMV